MKRIYTPTANLSKISNAKQQEVIELYKAGLSQNQIEKDLHMTRKTIRTILKNAGIERDKSNCIRLIHGYSLDESSFDILTSEVAYWIGFLYADGHISNGSRGYSIEVGVHTQDKEHLEKFRDFLKSNNKIFKDNRSEYYRIRIGSKKIHDVLSSYGFNNNKSRTGVPPTPLIDSVDFWRGVVDGDGSLIQISTTKHPFISLCGTFETTKGFLEYLRRNGLITKAEPSSAMTELSTQPFFKISFAARKAVQVANLLYKDATVYLERKNDVYLKYFK